MKITKEFVLREIAGDFILVPIGETALEYNGMITINELGAFIWKCLENETTIEKIVAEIRKEYVVDEATATTDTIEFINVLKQYQILEE